MEGTEYCGKIRIDIGRGSSGYTVTLDRMYGNPLMNHVFDTPESAALGLVQALRRDVTWPDLFEYELHFSAAAGKAFGKSNKNALYSMVGIRNGDIELMEIVRRAGEFRPLYGPSMDFVRRAFAAHK